MIAQTQTNDSPPDDAVAVVGMAGRFPGAPDIETYWANLKSGVGSLTRLSDEHLMESRIREFPGFVPFEGTIPDATRFDAKFFGIYPNQARELDPQHRAFLECCWATMEDAGYNPEDPELEVGVFAGCHMNSYILGRAASDAAFRRAISDTFPGGNLVTEIANDKDYLATRVSYYLNLRGPSMTIQTACSSSLVAIAQACQSLRAGDCDLALAGGVTVIFPQHQGYLHTEGSILSPDGSCRTFDSQARGTVFTDGVGAVLLKPYAKARDDRDDIYALIRGWGLSNDGADKAGYTAPSLNGQIRAIARAQERAGVSAESITYVEAHGTGTPVGDPIEVEALTEAFRRSTNEKQFCAIGSVKPNVGHLDVASGVASTIKTCLALKNRELPPTLNYESPNPRIDLLNSPFFVNAELAPWSRNGGPLRAGVSSFGVGGTNAHLVLEEAPEREASHDEGTPQLLILSAAGPSALDQQTQNLLGHLQDKSEGTLGDTAHTLQQGRKGLRHRRIVVASSVTELTQRASAGDGDLVFTAEPLPKHAPLVFLFPGQGSQHVGMARDLYDSAQVFSESVDRCAEVFRAHLGRDLREIIFRENVGSESRLLDQTAIAQPAIFMISYALAEWWRSLGIFPDMVLGHSVGEFAAACCSGVMRLEDAALLVAERGRLMQSLPTGSMMSVAIPEKEVAPLLPSGLEIAAVNSPTSCVVSGPEEHLSDFEERVAAAGLTSRARCARLRTSHAFHSAMMDPAVVAFETVVRSVELHEPQIPILSTVKARPFVPEEATESLYWSTQIREPVLFSSALLQVLQEPSAVLLEVGPGQALSNLARQHGLDSSRHRILSSSPHPAQPGSSFDHALATLGRLWQAGVDPDWDALHRCAKPRRVHLPTYPFEGEDYTFSQQGPDVGTTAALDEVVETPIAQPAPTQESAAPDGTAERVVLNQLRLMEQQLEILERVRNHDQDEHRER